MDFITASATALTSLSAAAVVYHHALYPLILKRAAVAKKDGGTSFATKKSDLPSITLFVPAYNEERYIAAKIWNAASLDYPKNKLRIRIVCDGCSDDTALVAKAAIEDMGLDDIAFLDSHTENRGKVHRLNQVIAECETELLILSDASALLSPDALMRVAAHFRDPEMGVVCGTYRLADAQAHDDTASGEAAYWDYQTAIKRGEAALGAPIGAHGALYAVRHAFARQLPLDTINDDFILPMEIIGQGKGAVYDSEIVALETAPSPEATDFARRVRIGAGNLQQAIRLRHLLKPSFGGVAFAFASGKVLRVLMPVLMVSALIGSLALALSDSIVAPVFQVAAAAQLLGYGLAVVEPMLGIFCGGCSATRIARAIRYLTVGHIASGWGALKYLRGDYRGGWRRGSVSGEAQRETLAANGGFDPSDFVPKGVRAGKRCVDILGALVGLALTLPLFPILALAIRLDSPGPVIFRQLRVGRMEHDRTIVFEMMKFRTMRSDAEAKSGAVWAQKNDPRVTRIGGFMRKTRLDELPQLLNVLRGDMSLIGPRPERPGFCGKLEDQIPLYIERTVGIRPGITGLAQVLQGYDETIDDVRSKIIFDNRYALSLTGVISWLRSDIEIVFRTMAVMVGARGR